MDRKSEKLPLRLPRAEVVVAAAMLFEVVDPLVPDVDVTLPLMMHAPAENYAMISTPIR
jgi:hypothetical protein